MRRWLVTLPKSPPLDCKVEAFDRDEAIALAAERLGISAEPCCETWPPCPQCEAERRADEIDRAYDRERDRRLLEQEETP